MRQCHRVDWRSEIDPELAPFMSAGGPTLGDLTLEELPALYDQRRATDEVETAAGIERLDVVLDGISLRVHRRWDQQRASACLYWIHGGGFIVGSNRMDDALLQQWTAGLGCVCAAVDYRLAPEDPYPAALDDCVGGFQAMLGHADELGIDRQHVGVGGVSAGGGLAVATALRLRDEGGARPTFLLLDAPSLDDRLITDSSAWDVPIAGPATIRLGWRAYLGDLYGSRDVPAYAAPARADDLTRLPPTFIAVGSVDGLHDEALDFGERLAVAGVDVETCVYQGGVHNFATIAPNSALAARARGDQDAWLGRHLSELQ